jgi:hypothetical protein
MRFDALRHIRDHSKTTGLPRLLLFEIGTHLNYHTGEAFLLSVDRLAHQLGVTPQWTRRLLHTLLAAGELVVARSRGCHANVYRIPYERCHACQEANPKLECRVDGDPEQTNPKLEPPQPETRSPLTLNWQGRQSGLWRGSSRLKIEIKREKDRKTPHSLARTTTPMTTTPATMRPGKRNGRGGMMPCMGRTRAAF